MLIESTKNQLIKRTRSLTAKKGRAETGLHFIEGDRLVREAVISGVTFADAFVEEGHELMYSILQGAGAEVHYVTRSVMKSIADTSEPQWVCATVKTPPMDVPLVYPHGLLVVLESVQDPGNVGTIIRTADAFGATGVLINENCADPFGPKTVRASMGSVYHIPVWCGNIPKELARMREVGYDLVCGHLEGDENLPAVGENVAVIIGNEGNGVTDKTADMCMKYRLPMYGMAESLNASVAAGIIMYEIARKIRE